MASNASTFNTGFFGPSACPAFACPAFPAWSNTFGGNFGAENVFGANPWTNTYGASFPSTFGANSWTNNTFGGNPWFNTYGANFPSTFGANPWTNTFGGNAPSTFGGNFPSTFGANFPSTFSGAKSWAHHALPCEYRDVPSRPMSIAEYWSFQNPIYTHPVNGSRLLHVTFDVKGFKPEEVKVEINSKERSIIVECKSESKVEKEHDVKRSYTRKFFVPEYCCVDLSKCDIKSHVTADGLLIVESVLPCLSVEELKNLKEKVAHTKSTPFVAGHNTCGPVVSIPIKTVA